LDIESKKSFRLYDWQKIIVSFVRFITESLHKNVVIEIPTGHGKTIIIAAIALAIAEDLN
jgi:CRISPR/Cas system-associated endonuclease/helicase Cas3